MNVLLIPASVLAMLGFAFFVLFFRLTSRRRISRYGAGLEEVFSPARYRALERALDDADQAFRQTRLGGDSRPERHYRNVRTVIFRRYLRQLEDDFNAICRAITVLMVTSEVDRPDLAGLLMKQNLIFAWQMLSVETRLALYGLGASRMEGRSLIASLDSMRGRLQSFAAIAQPTAA